MLLAHRRQVGCGHGMDASCCVSFECTVKVAETVTAVVVLARVDRREFVGEDAVDGSQPGETDRVGGLLGAQAVLDREFNDGDELDAGKLCFNFKAPWSDLQMAGIRGELGDGLHCVRIELAR